MKTFLSFLLFVLISVKITSAQNTSYSEALTTKKAVVSISYLNNFPYFYKDKKDSITGIEYDILMSFKTWLMASKGINVEYKFSEQKNFSTVYDDVKNNRYTLGAASITITDARKKEVKFTDPYLKNQALMIINGELNTVYDTKEMAEKFDTLIAVTVKNSIHEKVLNDIKKESFPNMKITYADNPIKVVEMIAANPKYYGYVDIISYWAYLQRMNKGFIKINWISNTADEYFGFVFPLTSDWDKAFNEFMEGGFGFSASRDYKQILEKHLNYEMLNSVGVFRK